MRVSLECGNIRRKNLPLVAKRIALKNALHHLDTFAHHSRGPDFLSFTLADFLHENLRRSQTEQKTVARQILHDACFHGNLNGMARVRRNDSPPQLNSFRSQRNGGEYSRGGSCFEGMLAPPGIRFGNPECVEARILTSLGHRQRFAHRFHTQLQHTNIERDRHNVRLSPG